MKERLEIWRDSNMAQDLQKREETILAQASELAALREQVGRLRDLLSFAVGRANAEVVVDSVERGQTGPGDQLLDWIEETETALAAVPTEAAQSQVEPPTSTEPDTKCDKRFRAPKEGG